MLVMSAKTAVQDQWQRDMEAREHQIQATMLDLQAETKRFQQDVLSRMDRYFAGVTPLDQ